VCVRQSNLCDHSIIVSLLLPVNLVGEGFLILSLSLAESKSRSWRLLFVERLRLVTADPRGARLNSAACPLFPGCVSALARVGCRMVNFLPVRLELSDTEQHVMDMPWVGPLWVRSSGIKKMGFVGEVKL
jgi:hypothetical protein